jgi:flagellar hook-associated protein 1 FlgK
MAVGFGSYEIAKSGLFVNEQALNVIGHNIANLDTPGYVRQQAMISELPCKTFGGNNGFYQLGCGAHMQQIRQIRNNFLDIMYRKENSSFGYWDTKQKTIHDIETVLGDPMEKGFQYVLDQFWDSWHELTKEPESLTIRAIVRQRGEELTNTINYVGKQLNKLKENLNLEIVARVKEINNITSEISKLNVTIQKYEVLGGTANDYRDKRDNLVDRLTRIIDVKVRETNKGQYCMSIDGYFLVNQEGKRDLYLEQDIEDKIKYKPKIEGLGTTPQIKSGILQGLMDSINEVEKIKNMLSNLVNTIVTEVNKLQKSGKTMTSPPQDGENFFSVINLESQETLGNIKINEKLMDLNAIITSGSGQAGDSTIALEIVKLKLKPLIADETGMLNVDEYYQTIISRIARNGIEASNAAENQYKLLQSTDANREALFGVSLDEEISNMMRFKFAYDASSRAFNVIDEMIEQIINRMGITGR